MYLLLKLLHLVAVIAFLGNITTGFFWHAHAARTRDARLLAHTLEGMIRSDLFFTRPGVIGILATGFATAMIAKMPIFTTGWIVWTLGLFIAAGITYGTRLAPLQRQMLALAQAGTQSGAFDYAAYDAIAARWRMWGAVAVTLPLVGLVIMVLKPF